MSAEANLAGLYPPVKDQIWDRIKWMPIPIHTIPEDQDYVLSGKKYCARYKYELEKVLNSPERREIRKANEKLYSYLYKNTGLKISTLEDVEHLYNTLYIEVRELSDKQSCILRFISTHLCMCSITIKNSILI